MLVNLMAMSGEKSAAKVDAPPVDSSSQKKGKRKAEDELKSSHVKRQRRAAWKKKWKKLAAQKKKKQKKKSGEFDESEHQSPDAKATVPAKKNLNVVAAYSDSESDLSAGGYTCELDTDGIDSSDEEHLRARIAAKTMSIGSFSFNIDQAEILFKDGGEVVEVRFPKNEVAVFRGFGHVELPPLLAKKKPDPNYLPPDPPESGSDSDVNADNVCKNNTDGIVSSDD